MADCYYHGTSSAKLCPKCEEEDKESEIKRECTLSKSNISILNGIIAARKGIHCTIEIGGD